MGRKLKVIFCEPGKEAVVLEVEDVLEAYQSLVGGHIELVYLDADNVIICDDEGKLKGEPLNRALIDDEGEVTDIIAGPFIVVGVDDLTGGFGDMSKDNFDKYYELFRQPESFFRDKDGTIHVVRQ